MNETNNQIYDGIALPIEITLSDGRAAKVVALRRAEQVEEAPIDVPDGQVLTEAVYNRDPDADSGDPVGQKGCSVRLALDLARDVVTQIVVAIG